MWKIKGNGELAENTDTGGVLRIVLCSDGLYRVKRNYKTIATFSNLEDAKAHIAKVVEELNRK